MIQTYSGTLCAGRIEWDTETPTGDDLRVLVTVMDSAEVLPLRNERLAAILTKLVASDIHTVIPDPHVWQRETRLDRPLPGRYT